MIVTTVEGIVDYMICGLFYHYRYEEDDFEIVDRHEILSERFNNTLKSVATYYFYRRQGDTPTSYRALLARWEKLWFPKDITAYDLAVERRDISSHNIVSYSNMAAASLERFTQTFADIPGTPVLINEDYFVPLVEGLVLEGTIDLVIKHGKTYKVFYFYTKTTRKFKRNLMMEIAGLKHAVEHKVEANVDIQYYTYNLASASTDALKRIHIPEVTDVDALKYWARKLTDNEDLVPKRGLTAYCRGCPYDDLCLQFSWKQQNEMAEAQSG